MKAIYNNQIIAESNDIVTIEGNAYFPIESLNQEYIKTSETTSVCPWKGTASYFSLEVDGKINKDAAWYYPQPKELAKGIKNRVAFWKGVNIIRE